MSFSSTIPIFPFAYLGKLILENKVLKIITLVLLALLIVISIGILAYANLGDLEATKQAYLIHSLLPFFGIPSLILIVALGSSYAERFVGKVDMELEKLRIERLEITQKIEDKNKLDIFNTIQLSLNQLNEYYTINKDQARRSFRFSLFAIVVGLITIIAGVWIHFLGIAKIELVYITGASGIILEFIGGAYFFMYNKSLEQVNLFFGQLKVK